MTLRDLQAFLWDIEQAAALIETFVDDRTLDEYLQDELLRSAVERQLGIIGEAASRALRHFPGIAEEVSNLPRIISFRNRLIHGYAEVSDEIVWAVVKDDLPTLQREVGVLLSEQL